MMGGSPERGKATNSGWTIHGRTGEQGKIHDLGYTGDAMAQEKSRLKSQNLNCKVLFPLMTRLK